MTLRKAINIYYSSTPKAKRTIHRILMWDPNKNVKQNAFVLGNQPSWALKFAKRFGLNYDGASSS